MRQSTIVRAYKALIKLGQQELPAVSAFELFKIKRELQPHLDFQIDEEKKMSAGATVSPDGSVTFPSPEAAAAFRDKLKEIGDMDVDLKVKPVQIPLSTPGLTLSMDDIEALDCFVQFSTNQKGGN
jgi:hypothetical protein